MAMSGDCLWMEVRTPQDSQSKPISELSYPTFLITDLATSGIPVLAGIAVDPARRGEGYGAAITAYLTRKAVATFGACTLGMFADNVTARRLYHRLGYRTGAQWSSRWCAHDPVVEHAPGRDRPSGRSPGRRTAVAP